MHGVYKYVIQRLIIKKIHYNYLKTENTMTQNDWLLSKCIRCFSCYYTYTHACLSTCLISTNRDILPHTHIEIPQKITCFLNNSCTIFIFIQPRCLVVTISSPPNILFGFSSVCFFICQHNYAAANMMLKELNIISI